MRCSVVEFNLIKVILTMKSSRPVHLFALCFLLNACLATQAMAQTEATTTSGQQPAASASPAALKLPDRFTAYAYASIGNSRRCVAGAITDEDGMKQVPAVYATNASNKRALWIARPELPADLYQSRATHCTARGDALYVLLQSDTQASQSLSQTLLRVVKLNASTGALQLQQDVEVPATYSAWVDKGESRFAWSGDRLVIAGNSRLASDHERSERFTVSLNSDLKPVGAKHE